MSCEVFTRPKTVNNKPRLDSKESRFVGGGHKGLKQGLRAVKCALTRLVGPQNPRARGQPQYGCRWSLDDGWMLGGWQS